MGLLRERETVLTVLMTKSFLYWFRRAKNLLWQPFLFERLDLAEFFVGLRWFSGGVSLDLR